MAKAIRRRSACNGGTQETDAKVSEVGKRLFTPLLNVETESPFQLWRELLTKEVEYGCKREYTRGAQNNRARWSWPSVQAFLPRKRLPSSLEPITTSSDRDLTVLEPS